MRIVRATNPPSMNVVVDTIIAGKVELSVRPAHAEYDRIDIAFAKEGVVGILPGTPAASPCSPAIATGMRRIARIFVHKGRDAIYDMCVLEEDEEE